MKVTQKEWGTPGSGFEHRHKDTVFTMFLINLFLFSHEFTHS